MPAGIGGRCSAIRVEPRIEIAHVVNNTTAELSVYRTTAKDALLDERGYSQAAISRGLKGAQRSAFELVHARSPMARAMARNGVARTYKKPCGVISGQIARLRFCPGRPIRGWRTSQKLEPSKNPVRFIARETPRAAKLLFVEALWQSRFE